MNEQTKQPPRVAITTLGCKVNQYESASFLSSLEAAGAQLVPFTGEADVYIINTCAVTGKAASQSRQLIRRALRQNKEARIVVTGCYSQVAAREVVDLAERAVCIVGNGFKDQLVDIALAEDYCDLEMFMGDISRRREICHLPVAKFAGRTRGFLKIQDGCDRFCSYCIVPYARGPSRSLPAAEVLQQAATLIGHGYREIVLTGIHIGLYGNDFDPETSLVRLLEKLIRLPGSVRYRISSLESAEISSELLDLMAASDRIMPHLHIPLQSGCDAILARMNRTYRAADYRRVVEECVARMPDMAIGADVLVGFPGESEADFAVTEQFLAGLPVSYLHVFPYSKRPGTVAAEMDGQVPKQVKEERVARLKQLDHQKRTAFYGRFLGHTRPVLTETGRNRFRLMRGFSDNYIPVFFPAAESLANEIVRVRIDRLVDCNVFGTMAPDARPAGAAPGGEEGVKE